MKKFLTTSVVIFVISNFVFFQGVNIAYASINWINGYFRSDGTYVEGHFRTSPNSYKWDNLGSDGIDMDGDGYGAGIPNRIYDLDNDGIYDGFYSYSHLNDYSGNKNYIYPIDYNYGLYDYSDLYDNSLWSTYDYDLYNYFW